MSAITNGGADNSRKRLVRDEVINKAAELFAARGWSRTNFNEISQELGLSRSALYHYFRNKEEILEALIADQSAATNVAIKALIADRSLSASERVREAIRLGVERKLTGGARFRLLDQIEFELPEALAEKLRRNKRSVLELWTKMISDGIKAGEFRNIDARIAAFAVIGMSNWTAWWYSPDGRKGPEEIADLIADFGVRGLTTNSSASSNAQAMEAIRRDLRNALTAVERLT